MGYERDTAMGNGPGRFPMTRHSAIALARSDDAGERERAWDAILGSYWKPAYKYFRVQWNKGNEDAKDLTQGFFLAAMEKGYFRSYEPGKGSFRGYLRTCLDGFVMNQNAAAGRLKRGGGMATVPLDFETAEGELRELPLAGGMATEEFFYQEWVRHLFASAVEELRAECAESGKMGHFVMMEKYDLERTVESYVELAAEMGLAVAAVTNHLAWARRQFRRIVLRKIREVSGTEEEFQQEARLLLGGRALR